MITFEIINMSLNGRVLIQMLEWDNKKTVENLHIINFKLS